MMTRIIVAILLMMGMVSISLADNQTLARRPLVRWSPDGQWIATVYFDGIVSITSLSMPSQLIELTHEGSISDIAWSPDSTRIGVGLYVNENIPIWDATTGSLIKTLQGDNAYDGAGMYLEWNPEQELLATITDDWDGTPIRFWETQSYSQIGLTGDIQNRPDPMKWNSDGTQLAIATPVQGLKIYDLFAGENISAKHYLQWIPFPGGIAYVDWSPDGKYLAAVKYETQFVTNEKKSLSIAEHDSFVVILDAKTLEDVTQLTQPVHNAVNPILWSPDGSRIAILNADHIDVIDAQTGVSLERISVESPNYDAAWSPFGGRLAIVGASAENAQPSNIPGLQFVVPAPSFDLIENIESVCVSADVMAADLPDAETDIDAYIEAVAQNEAIAPGCAADLVAVAEAMAAETQSLRDMLLPAECPQACYFGIQPEITTREELETFLAQNQIVPEISFSETIDNSKYVWELPLQTPFTFPLGRGNAVFRNGKIIQMGLTLDIPVPIIYEIFGYPDVVISDGDTDVDLIYKDLGIAFLLSRSKELSRTAYVVLASTNSQYETYISYPPDKPVDHPCSSYGVFPCIAPTATPMPR